MPSQRYALSAPNVATLMMVMHAITILMGTQVYGRSTGNWGAASVNGTMIVVSLAACAGLVLRKKWGWWLGVLWSGFWALTGIVQAPVIPQIIGDAARMAANAKSGDTATLGLAAFVWAAVIAACMMLVAFGALLWPSTRRAFNIGARR